MTPERAPDWLPVRRPRSAPQVRLVAAPGAGSGAGLFRGWEAALPDWIEFRPVAAPGREHRIREPVPTRLGAHVDGVVEALDVLEPLPLALLGHSMGALVAWEVARALRRRGAPRPLVVFVSGMLPPDAPRPWPPIADRPDAPLLEELRARFGGFPPALDAYPELRRLMLPTVRGDLAAFESHRPAPEAPLALPIRLLAGREDRAAPPEALRPWERHTRAGSRLATFAGAHDFIAGAPAGVVAWVADQIREILEGRAEG